MRKIVKYLFSALVLVSSFLGLANAGAVKSVLAEEESSFVPSYFSVKKTDNTVVSNGGTAFISGRDTLLVSLNESETALITDITPYIVLNGEPLSNIDIEKMANVDDKGTANTDDDEMEYYIKESETLDGSYLFVFNISGEKIFNNKRSDGSQLYGKLDLTFDYHESVDGAIINRNFSYTFYLLKTDDYNLAKYKIENATSVGSSVIYNNEYNYNFEKAQLPYFTYDARFFDLYISKATLGEETKYLDVKYRGEDLNLSNEIVYVSNEGSLVTIVFNDLADYTIRYTYIHQYDGKAFNLVDKNASNELVEYDSLSVAGFTLNYTEDGERKEFKNIDEKGKILNSRTDFTYYYDDKTSTEDEAIDNVIANVNNYLKTKDISLATSNQVPLQVGFSKEINFSKSYLYKLKLDDGDYVKDGEKVYLENEFITSVGQYLLKVEATDGSIQVFVFEINSTVPSFVTLSYDRVLNQEISKISTGDYTNQKVLVKYSYTPSMFDTKTRLIVYQYAYDKTTFIRETIISANELSNVFSENGYYVVALFYGNKTSPTSTSSFIIDNNPITDFEVFNVTKVGTDRYAKVSDLQFLTNNNFAVHFNNKESGAIVSCEYKRFPLEKISANYLDYFNTGSALKTFYNQANNFSIPTLYYFDVDESKIAVPYLKPSNSSYISSTSVLSDPGVYVFRLTDTSGQEKFISYVLDNTSPVILQTNVDGNFVEVEDINTVSNDTTIYWGQQKIIKMQNFNASSEDKWISSLYNDHRSYFANYTLKGETSYYFEVQVNGDVYKSTGGLAPVLVNQNEIVKHGTTIYFLDANGKANEGQYVFYFRDESNQNYASTKLENYTLYPSSIYSVKVTSDASRLEVFYKKDSKDNSLVLSSYSTEDITAEGYSLKNQYYQPTNKSTFSSDGVLYLEFLSKPNENVIEIDSVTCDYYPYIRKNVSSFYYSEYDEENGENFVIYKYDATGILTNDLTTFNESNGKQQWKVNTYYNNQLNREMTREGKYVVRRVYKILSDTINTTNKNYDYIIREYTFYVDRNSIITSPEVISGSEVQSIVGGGIKVKITNSYFTEVYTAQNYTNRSKNALNTHEGSVYEIFKTNKLPVKIMIPYYKYGYETEAGNSFEYANSMYFDKNNKAESLIVYNTLKVSIYKYLRLNDVETGNYDQLVYSSENPVINSGYITLPDLTNGGYYEVVISQNDPTAPQYVFLFHISEEAPEFSLRDDNNIEFESLDLTSGREYYTNEDLIRVSWQDSVNPYMAKIDHNGISFYASYLDGSTSSIISISESLVKQGKTERDFYVDINLADYKTLDLANIYSIFVTAKFESIEEDGSGYFVGNSVATKQVIIDRLAPNESIEALLNESGLKVFENQIRVKQGYNTVTNAEGRFRNFAFAVDKSKVNDLIKINKTNGLNAYKTWYRSVDKYGASHENETDPNGFVASATYKVLDANEYRSMLINHYYEIIESDLAGNIAVYTIYLTDYEAEQKDKTIISWTTPVKEGEDQLILLQDYSSKIEIYSKKNFNINKITLFKNENNSGYPWWTITVKGITYYHSPYLLDNELVTLDGEKVNLENVTSLSVKDEMQEIIISNEPYFNSTSIRVGVISENKTLSYLHFSEITLPKEEDGTFVWTDLDGNTLRAKEGIIIEIPQGQNRANIYATNVTIIYNDTKQLSISVPLNSEESLKLVESTENIKIAGFRNGSKLYAVVYIVKPIDNTYYVYQIKDNFGQLYPPKTYIFGAEVANENFISDVPVATRLDGNNEWYYSTKAISFEFNKEKNYVVFKGLNINGVVKDVNTKDATAKAELRTANIILENISSVVYKITVLAPQEIAVNGIIGSKRVVQFIIYNNITVSIDGFDNSGRNCTFVINNTAPEINLFGKNNENLNAILGNIGMIVGPPVTIKFMDTSNEEYPNIVYLQNRDTGASEIISSGHIVSKPGNYSILIGYADDTIFAGINYLKRVNFKLSDDAVEFYAVYVDGSEKVASPTGKPFEIEGIDGKSKDVIYTHYIVNSTYKIYCNEGQKIEAIKQTAYNLPSTTVYKITNHNATGVDYNLNYFETLIAITVIEKTNTIIDKFSYIEPEGTTLTLYDKLEVNGSSNKENHTVVMEKGSSYEAVAKYSFNSYYGIKENIISAIVTDENGQLLAPRMETIGTTTYIYFDMSGYYRIKFVDLAGNKHLFNATDNFEVTYLSSVIFNVNGLRPVNNAIYDNAEPTIISIPTSSRTLYDNRTVPTIHVERNGKPYTPTSQANNTIYTFTEAGLYKVWFSAVVGGKPVREEVYYFTIINSLESRWAFEFQEYASYYINRIVKDGVDILDNLLRNPTIGTHILVEQNGETVTKLKNVLISLYDEQTGAGRYDVEIKTNDTNNATFFFSFWINSVEPPISISVKEGEETTNDIIVRFSKTKLFLEAGECIVRINGYKDLELSLKNVMESQENGTDIIDIKLTEAKTYYIQLYSASDKLLYSYTVTKKAPLNAISIIIIVVVTLAVAGLVTMYILLRKKMKVR